MTGELLAHHVTPDVLAVQVAHADAPVVRMLAINIASDLAAKDELSMARAALPGAAPPGCAQCDQVRGAAARRTDSGRCPHTGLITPCALGSELLRSSIWYTGRACPSRRHAGAGVIRLAIARRIYLNACPTHFFLNFL